MNIWDHEITLNEIDSKSQIISNQSKSIDEFIDDFGNKSYYHKIIADLITLIAHRLEKGFIYHKEEVLNYIENNGSLTNYKDLFAVWDKLYQFKYKFEKIKNTISNIREKPWINQEIANTLNLKKELNTLNLEHNGWDDKDIVLDDSDFAQTTLVSNLQTQVYDKIQDIKKSIEQLEQFFTWRIIRSFDSRFENIYYDYLYINDTLKGTRWSSKVARLFVDEFLKDDGIFTWEISQLIYDLKTQFYNHLASKELINRNNYHNTQDTEWDRSFFKNQKTLFEELTKEYKKNQEEFEGLFEDDLSEWEKEPIRQDIIKNIYKIWTTQYFSKRG